MELREFLRVATKKERADLAAVCHDSVSYLYQLAGKHRHASALMAARIEKQTLRIAESSSGRLRPVPRETLVRHPEIFEREGTFFEGGHGEGVQKDTTDAR